MSINRAHGDVLTAEALHEQALSLPMDRTMPPSGADALIEAVRA